MTKGTVLFACFLVAALCFSSSIVVAHGRDRVAGERILGEEIRPAQSVRRPAACERRFELTGYVESTDPWIVSGVAIETRGWTEIKPGADARDAVKVEGHILENGEWVADEIEPLKDDLRLHLEFVGVVQAISDVGWTISGVSLAVDDQTEIVGHIPVGTLVKVDAEILPGAILALEIVGIDETHS